MIVKCHSKFCRPDTVWLMKQLGISALTDGRSDGVRE